MKEPDFIDPAAENEAELARAIRREVRRVHLQEQTPEMQEEARQDEQEQEEEQARKARQEKRKRRLFWQLLSGSILIREGSAPYYRYLLLIAAMFFASISVMFWSLHLDMRHARLEKEVLLLRERATKEAERRQMQTSHSAIEAEIVRRGLGLEDPPVPAKPLDAHE